METEKIITISISGISLIWAIRNRLLDYSVAHLYYFIRNPKEGEYEFLLFSKSKKIIKYSELGRTVGLQLHFLNDTEITSIQKGLESNKNIDLAFDNENNMIILKFDYMKRNMFASINIQTKGEKSMKPILEGDFMNNNRIIEYSRVKFLLHKSGRVLPMAIFFIIPLFYVLDSFQARGFTKVLVCFCYGVYLFDLFGWFRKTKLDKILDIKTKNQTDIEL